jgi:hypothetical protein
MNRRNQFFQHFNENNEVVHSCDHEVYKYSEDNVIFRLTTLKMGI